MIDKEIKEFLTDNNKTLEYKNLTLIKEKSSNPDISFINCYEESIFLNGIPIQYLMTYNNKTEEIYDFSYRASKIFKEDINNYTNIEELIKKDLNDYIDNYFIKNKKEINKDEIELTSIPIRLIEDYLNGNLLQKPFVDSNDIKLNKNIIISYLENKEKYIKDFFKIHKKSLEKLFNQYYFDICCLEKYLESDKYHELKRKIISIINSPKVNKYECHINIKDDVEVCDMPTKINHDDLVRLINDNLLSIPHEGYCPLATVKMITDVDNIILYKRKKEPTKKELISQLLDCERYDMIPSKYLKDKKILMNVCKKDLDFLYEIDDDLLDDDFLFNLFKEVVNSDSDDKENILSFLYDDWDTENLVKYIKYIIDNNLIDAVDTQSIISSLDFSEIYDAKDIVPFIVLYIEEEDEDILDAILSTLNKTTLNSPELVELIKPYKINFADWTVIDDVELKNITNPKLLECLFSADCILSAFTDLNEYIKNNKNFIIECLQNDDDGLDALSNENVIEELADIYKDDKEMVDILINIFPHDSETLDIFTNYFNIDTKNIEDMYEKTSKNINFIRYLSKEESYIYIKDECLGYIDMKLSSNKQEIEFTTNFGILTIPYNRPTYACFEDMEGRYISIRKYLQNDTITFLNELLEEINERNPKYNCIKYKDIDKNFKEIYNFLQKDKEEER